MTANPLSSLSVTTSLTSLQREEAAFLAEWTESFVKYIDLNCSASISSLLWQLHLEILSSLQ